LSLRSWIAERFQEPEPLARLIPLWRQNQPLTPVQDFRRLTEDGYRRNVVIFACIRELATSAAEPALEVGRPGKRDQFEPIEGFNPLKNLLARPNPEQGQYAFLEELNTHFHVAGNAFIHKVRSGVGRPVQLWNLRPDRMTIVPGPDGNVSRYEYKIGDAKPKPVPAEDIIHLKEPDPLDDYWGLSRIAVLARQGDIDNAMSDFVRTFFLNGGQPIGALMVKGKVRRTERQRITQEWRDEYSGVQGWHAIAVISGDAEYKEIGARPDRILGLEALTDLTESRICAAFNIPPEVVGVRIGLKRKTFSNYKEARESLWKDNLAPHYRRVGDALTHGLAPEFGGELLIRFNLGTVEALQEDTNERFERGLKGWNDGLLTLNQALVLAGYDEVEGGNVRKLSTQDIIVPEGELGAAGGNGQQASLPGRSVIFLDPYSSEWLDLPQHRALPATTDGDKKKDS
jgi:HK97 family phage portal protein